jgi:hypothetical protein
VKSIVITASYGAAIRDVLRTNIFSYLKSAKIKIIILTPQANDKNFINEFKDDNVFIYPLFSYKPNFFEATFREIYKIFFYKFYGSRTFNLMEKRDENKFTNWKYLIRRVIWYFPIKLPLLMSIYRKIINNRINIDNKYLEIFNKYNPDLVLSTMPFLLDEQPILKLATIKKIPIVGRIHSWDNITSKGPLYFHFNKVLVWSDIMKNEMLHYYDNQYVEDEIITAGASQFDYYFSYRPISKKAFFNELGIDQDSKLILFSTAHSGISPNEPKYVKDVYEILESKKIKYLLLVRLHPRDNFRRYGELTKLKNIRFEYPGRKANQINDQWDPNLDDMKHFVHLLKYADININVASTVTIDAAVFNTPIINLAYDPIEINQNQSISQYYKYDHYLPIVKSQGVKIVYSKKELAEAVSDYLENPLQDQQGRAQIVKEQIKFTDGQAGKKTADLIINFISK